MAAPGNLSSFPRISIVLGLGSAILVLLVPGMALLGIAAAAGAILLGNKAARSPAITYRSRRHAMAGLSLGMTSLCLSAVITMLRLFR